MMQYLPLVATLVSLLALVWNISSAKTERTRLEASFAATVDGKINVLSTRFSAVEANQQALAANLTSALERLNTYGEKIAVLMDRTPRTGGGGEKVS